jgi:hypothetical protein
MTSAKYIGMDVHKESISIAVLIATIVLLVWKRGVNFDAQFLKPAPSLDFSGGGVRGPRHVRRLQ